MRHQQLQSIKTNSAGQGAAAVRMELKQGALAQEHQHDTECLVVVLEGALRVSVRGQSIIVRANEMLHIPPQLEHSAEAIADSVALSISPSSAEEWSGCGPFVHDDPEQYLWGV